MKFIQQTLLVAALVMASCSIMAGEKEQSFDITAQDLGPALQKLAAQSGVSVFYTSDSVAGLRAQALKGQYSINAALTKLLSGSGLAYSLSADGSISVKPASDKLNTADPTTLKPMKVVGKATYDATNPYNPDYVLPNATSGTKTDTPIMETPLNVQVVSKQVLQDQQVITLDQAMKNVSGVYAAPRDDGTGGSVFLRGFQTYTYYRNGFRIDNPSNNSMALNDRQMANVESVEVLKGASAILYGRTDPGGMVNVMTKQPLETPYYALTQQFGNFSTYRTSFDSTGPLTKDNTLLYRVNGSYQDQGSFRDGVNTGNFFLAPIIKWNISPRTNATLEMEYQHDTAVTNFGYALTLNGQVQPNLMPWSRNYLNPNASTSVQDTYFMGFNWSHQFNDDWSIKNRYQVNKNDKTGPGQFISGVTDIGGVPVAQLVGGTGTIFMRFLISSIRILASTRSFPQSLPPMQSHREEESCGSQHPG